MLIDITSRKEIMRIPHPETSKLIQDRLSPGDFNGVVDEINKRIDEAGGEIATAGFLPGPDWSNTPFQCIHDTAAKKNKEFSAKMFGLMVWYTIMQRPERWGFGRYNIGDREIESLTYFRLGD